MTPQALASHLPLVIMLLRHHLSSARRAIQKWILSAAAGGPQVQSALAAVLPVAMCVLRAVADTVAADSGIVSSDAIDWLCDGSLHSAFAALAHSGAPGARANLCRGAAAWFGAIPPGRPAERRRALEVICCSQLCAGDSHESSHARLLLLPAITAVLRLSPASIDDSVIKNLEEPPVRLPPPRLCLHASPHLRPCSAPS